MSIIWKFKRLNVSDIAMLGMLIAINFVLNRFTIPNKFIQFNFGFIIVALIGQWYGPSWNAAIAIVIDILSSLLNGTGYFPGFTLSAVLSAIIYGCFFYNYQHLNWRRIILTQFLVTIIVNIVLNTAWIIMLNKQIPQLILEIRMLKEILTFPIQVVLIYLICNNKRIQKVKDTINQK